MGKGKDMEKDKVAVKVVVIGGSAGSLEALLSFLPRIPSVPYAIVIVVHRKGGDDRMLEDLIASKCILIVDDFEDKTILVPNKIFVAPSDYHLLFEKNGQLSVDLSPKVNYSRPSIDVTFESASEAYGEAVVGLLLSGANADGTQGLIDIKNAGGTTAIQDPKDSSIDYMPEHARVHANPDFILKVAEIPDWLLSLK